MHRRDALKAIAGTALIPVVGITPALAGASETIKVVATASWQEQEYPFDPFVALKFNVDPKSPYIESVFNSMLKMFPKAEEINITGPLNLINLRFTKQTDLAWDVSMGKNHAQT